MKYDYIVIGSGIIGLTIAYDLIKRFSKCKIAILEKEEREALHSSGRNSGVLHAGFYYTSDSLKAKFTRNGNFEMKAFCKKYNLKINHSKKVVVAQNEQDVDSIYELHKRGIKNNVRVEVINESQLQKIDS